MRETFVAKRFNRARTKLIEQANAILAEYDVQGLILTLRQLYYQFVARSLLPNSKKEYLRLNQTMSEARLAGLVDWAMIEDRTRNLNVITCWDGPPFVMEAVADQYKED